MSAPEPLKADVVDDSDWETERQNRIQQSEEKKEVVECPESRCDGEIVSEKLSEADYPNPHAVYTCDNQECSRHIEQKTREKIRICMYYGNTPTINQLFDDGD